MRNTFKFEVPVILNETSCTLTTTENNTDVQFKTKSSTSNTIMQSLVFITIITSRENLAQQSEVVSHSFKDLQDGILGFICYTSYHC